MTLGEGVPVMMIIVEEETPKEKNRAKRKGRHWHWYNIVYNRLAERRRALSHREEGEESAAGRKTAQREETISPPTAISE